jgi:hypothetical protein
LASGLKVSPALFWTPFQAGFESHIDSPQPAFVIGYARPVKKPARALHKEEVKLSHSQLLEVEIKPSSSSFGRRTSIRLTGAIAIVQACLSLII